MKTISFLLILILFACKVDSQIIPYTNSLQIYNTDSGSIMNAYKMQLPQSGQRNLYIQRSGRINPNPDFRHGNIYRWLQGNSFTDMVHNDVLKSAWSFNNYYNFGYIIDFSFSSTDTNFFIFSALIADWEPYMSVKYTENNGLNISPVFIPSFMAQTGSVCIDPINDSVIYATYKKSGEVATLHKSTNRGLNWFDLDTINLISDNRLYVNPLNLSIIFFCMGDKIYKSTEGGYNFQQIFDSLSKAKFIFNQNENAVYLISSSPGKGLKKTTNNGINWSFVNRLPMNDLEIDPMNNNIFYGATGNGIYKSINRGQDWFLYNNSFSSNSYVHKILKNPNMGDTLVAVGAKGVYKVFGKGVKDTLNASYFPLKVGNVYLYKVRSLPAPDSYLKLRITSAENINGYTYYNFSSFIPGMSANQVRYDSLTGVIRTHYDNQNCNGYTNQVPIDSLPSKKKDTLIICNSSYRKSICIDTLEQTVFGYTVKSKTFYQDDIITVHRTYSYGFGLTQIIVQEVDNTTYTLVGAYINNTLYGDTTVSGINLISKEIPTHYSLSQNYPNPFNPVTKINFSIPKSGFVKIILYDILGKQVRTILSEKKETGYYSIDFNASDLTSGVYFYKFESGNFTDIKKMLVIK